MNSFHMINTIFMFIFCIHYIMARNNKKTKKTKKTYKKRKYLRKTLKGG